jgi:Antitoxin VbhA
MNAVLNPTITAAESAKRKAAIDFARGSVRLEGVVLSSEIESINQQYIDGQIDADTRRALSFAASEREFAPAV